MPRMLEGSECGCQTKAHGGGNSSQGTSPRGRGSAVSEGARKCGLRDGQEVRSPGGKGRCRLPAIAGVVVASCASSGCAGAVRAGFPRALGFFFRKHFFEKARWGGARAAGLHWVHWSKQWEVYTDTRTRRRATPRSCRGVACGV
jgi:hypothetical protein